jgi:hypothetical protein
MSKTNGQIRKSLGEQIDRLDAMLNGLAEGLTDAVAQAVKDAVGTAVKEAVQGVLRETLTSPELLVRLQAAAPPAAAPAAPADAKMSAAPSRWATTWKAPAAWLMAAGAHGVRLLVHWVAGAWTRAKNLACYKYQMLAGVAAALVVGVTAYLARPWLAAAARAMSRSAVMVGVQAATAGRRIWADVAGSFT